MYKQQSAAFDTWDMGYTKDGASLLITYKLKDKTIEDFFLEGDDKGKLLAQGHLQEKADAYIVAPVKSIMDGSKITGIKILKKLPETLDATVTFNAVAFKINNKENNDWANCTFEINSKVFSDGYSYKSSKGIKAKDSKRFDFFSEKPEKLFIACTSMEQDWMNSFIIK